MIKVNPEYCHDWQIALAELLEQHGVTSGILLKVINELNYTSMLNSKIPPLVDTRHLLTVRPYGHPEKLWYGLTLEDTLPNTVITSGAFVGWIPANEMAYAKLSTTHSTRTKEFSETEHIGVLSLQALAWNKAIRHYHWLSLTNVLGLVRLHHESEKQDRVVSLIPIIKQILDMVGK